MYININKIHLSYLNLEIKVYILRCTEICGKFMENLLSYKNSFPAYAYILHV